MSHRRHRLVDRRRVVGLSQEGLAEALHVDRTTVARWERGETTPQPWHRPGLAAALKLSVEELDKLLAEPDDVPSTTEELGESARLPVSAADGSQRPGSEVYASALQSFRAADRQVGGGHLYATVVSYLHRDIAPDLFRAFSASEGRAVFAAAAALTEMAGWMAHDAGRDDAAREHFVRSYDLAEVGGDRQLTAHILASMSHLAHHLAQLEEAVSLARQGRERLSAGPRAPEPEALLLALEARGVAALGERRACVHLLDQAEAVLTQSPDDTPSPWVSRFDEAALANEAAHALYQLGDLHEARRQAERIIALRPRDRARSRAFGQLLLATVLLARGRLDEACALATEVLATTRHLGSYVVVRHLLDLRRQLRPQHRSAATTEFLGALDEALQERRWLLPGEPDGNAVAAAGRP